MGRPLIAEKVEGLVGNSFGKLDEIVHPLPRAVAACSYNIIEAIGRLKDGDTATDVLLVDPGSFLQ